MKRTCRLLLSSLFLAACIGLTQSRQAAKSLSKTSKVSSAKGKKVQGIKEVIVALKKDQRNCDFVIKDYSKSQGSHEFHPIQP